MATERFLTLDDFLGTNRKTYVWHVPSLDKDVELKRLTHGEVKDLNAMWRAAGNRISDEIQDKVVEMGLVRPAVTAAQLNDLCGDRAALTELYMQIATECSFIVVRAAAAPKSDGEASTEGGDAPDPLAEAPTS